MIYSIMPVLAAPANAKVFSNVLVPDGWEAKMKQIKTLDIRDDDILVCTFPKSGIVCNAKAIFFYFFCFTAFYTSEQCMRTE